MSVPEQVSSTSSRWAAMASRSTVVMRPIYLRLVNTVAITRRPSPLLESGERTHIGRDAIAFDRPLNRHDGYRAALAELGARVTRLDGARGTGLPRPPQVRRRHVPGWRVRHAHRARAERGRDRQPRPS